MKAENFVDQIVQTVSDLAGLPRLRLVFSGLITHENVILMGRGAMNYTRYKDHKSSQYNSIIFPCYTDHTEHKNHC